MRLSSFFLKTLKENSVVEEGLPSQKLMQRAGMVRKAGAPGLFAWMPLGVRVLSKIEEIIDKEMELAGAQKVNFPVIQSAEAWYQSGRLKEDSGYGPEMLRFLDRNENEMLVSPTAEELFTTIVSEMNLSHRDLPLNLYQVEKKFRDEVRPRFGTLRSREFTMKDGYSFDTSEEASFVTYCKMFAAYQRIFDRIGVDAIPLEAPRGPVGGSLSHEFVIPTNAGESDILYDIHLTDPALIPAAGIYKKPSALLAHFNEVTGYKGMTAEMLTGNNAAPTNLLATRGIEVAHIFQLGTRYSEPLNAAFKNKHNKPETMHMGCYGIGVSRLPAAIIEAANDKDGIVWSPSVAPFQAVVINASMRDESANALAEEIYENLKAQGIDIAYDDRDMSVGGKFADMDLIGIPVQIRVGKREAEARRVEIKGRQSGEVFTVSVPDVAYTVQKKLQPRALAL